MRRDRPRLRDVFSAKTPEAGAGRWLALVPLGVAVFLAALLLPRGVVPEGVPMPELDDRVIAREIRADTDRVRAARETPLSPDVRALGSAILDFNAREARDATDVELSDARAAINRARARVVDQDKDEDLRVLRAVHMEEFLAEVRRFERTGETSDELGALGGSFVRRMRKVGWCQGHAIVLTDLERRAAFKATWNTLIEVDKKDAFKLSMMETRALYTLYFTHPHAPEPQRAAFLLARAAAKDQAACDRIDQGERAGAQGWLLTKLAEYAPLDPSYPILIARGVVYYQRRQYGDAARSFGQWLEAHPNGPWTLRARNYLRASVEAQEASL